MKLKIGPGKVYPPLTWFYGQTPKHIPACRSGFLKRSINKSKCFDRMDFVQFNRMYNWYVLFWKENSQIYSIIRRITIQCITSIKVVHQNKIIQWWLNLCISVGDDGRQNFIIKTYITGTAYRSDPCLYEKKI